MQNEFKSGDNPSVWFVNNYDKWYRKGGEIHFTVPLEQIPPEILEDAAAYKASVENSIRRVRMWKAMGFGDGDWD